MSGLIVLGIDPGSRMCGYGVIGPEGQYVASGTIVLPVKEPLHVRLKELYDELLSVIEEFRPDVAAVEKIFFAKSVKSAFVLGQARGVALLAASSAGLEVNEYAATEVKKAVTGYGGAEKVQVQGMVKSILGLDHDLSPDGADAIAVALCHRNVINLEDKIV